MTSSEIAHDFSPHLRVYKDGRVERLEGTATVPPSYDRDTGVLSKDVAISASTPSLSARVYIPTATTINHRSGANRRKLPLLVYFHGGAFCLESPFSPMYHNYLNSLASEADAVAVSVHYRRAPEHPLPAAYDDSWIALEWVSSHSGGDGPDKWLSAYADLRKVYVAGDSAGGNIAHHMGLRFAIFHGQRTARRRENRPCDPVLARRAVALGVPVSHGRVRRPANQPGEGSEALEHGLRSSPHLHRGEGRAEGARVALSGLAGEERMGRKGGGDGGERRGSPVSSVQSNKR
ncbi:probable carboxylesterase 13 isoform X2 [Rhodamnia argentea]|uniref:Probable carboxylesterase 13 isoform X2 n=1 Tax=Rhodamnia argentea TaxID=178133 RepID=A0ABM3HGP3_9MYRT|nr:probable carboxylesterase 13 isoform X2 [Rhodamnia argentea]